MPQLNVSEHTLNTLQRWASVGRTIDAAVAICVEHNTEQSQYTAEELSQLKQALDECGRAAK